MVKPFDLAGALWAHSGRKLAVVAAAWMVSGMTSISPAYGAADRVTEALRLFYRSVEPTGIEAVSAHEWIQRLKKAIEQSPATVEGAQAALVIGELWLGQGNAVQALPWFRKSVSWRPTGDAWVILAALKRTAQIHMTRREWVEGLTTLRAFEDKCAHLSKEERQMGLVRPHLQYLSILPIKKAKCLSGLGRSKEAAAEIERYIASVESGRTEIPREYDGLGFDVPNTLWRLAESYLNSGDRESAVAAYDKILAKYPSSLDRAMVSYRRMVALGLSEDDQLKEMARIAAAFPKEKYSLELMDRLAVRYARLQRPLSVIRWAGALLTRLEQLPAKEAAKKGFLRRGALLYLAEAYGMLGDYHRARDYFGLLAQEYPDEAKRKEAQFGAARMSDMLSNMTRLEPTAAE